MKVEVLLFGNPRELAGTSTEVLSLEEGTRLSNLLEVLGSRHGKALADELRHTEALTIMINGRHFASLGGVETLLKDEDTVAILPITFGG
jgi:molybdopterin converting factor small subunit